MDSKLSVRPSVSYIGHYKSTQLSVHSQPTYIMSLRLAITIAFVYGSLAHLVACALPWSHENCGSKTCASTFDRNPTGKVQLWVATSMHWKIFKIRSTIITKDIYILTISLIRGLHHQSRLYTSVITLKWEIYPHLYCQNGGQFTVVSYESILKGS